MKYNTYYTVPYDDKQHLELLFDFFGKKKQAERLIHGYFPTSTLLRSYFESRLKENAWSDFEVLMRLDTAIGFGFLHDLRPTSCSLSIALFEKYQKSGAGVLLGWKMLEHAFKYEHFNRVFAWVFETNVQSLMLHKHATTRGWLEYHGYLPDQYMLSDVPCGTHIFSIARKKFEMIRSKNQY